MFVMQRMIHILNNGCVCVYRTPSTLDRKKIIAVIDTTYAVVKRKPEKKNQACTGFEPYDLCDTGAVLYQLS